MDNQKVIKSQKDVTYMEQIVFYGAGEHAFNNYSNWIEEGLIPVCFVDSDADKQHTVFKGLSRQGQEGSVMVLSLAEAIEKYPDYSLYLTVGQHNMLPVRNYLLEQGIPRERIKIPGTFEIRKGCSFLGGAEGSFLAYSGENLFICCYVDRQFLQRTETVEQDIEKAQNLIDAIIDDLRYSRPTSCDACPNLVEGIYRKYPKINRIGINSYLDDTVCNFKCIYCGVAEAFHKTKDNLDAPLDLVKKIYSAVSKCENKISLSLSAGEISISPWRDKLLAFIGENNWRNTRLLTNAYVYVDKIAELIKDGIVTTLCVSMDAGTRSTFAKVKCVDGWDRVCENLEKYAIIPGTLQLKYIMMRNINDNSEDVLGFLELCKRLGADAMLSKDVFAERKLFKSELDACLLFIRQAKKQNTKVLLLSEFFYSKEDRQTLEDAFNE